ncbi:hypothetical protein HD554DRAFT_2141616 [Boletus coccyginus]|nr:hypothetical protein HD554DRAFT_2141616 [Boletus coccyginus]
MRSVLALMSLVSSNALTRIPIPRCHNMHELPTAATERTRVQDMLCQGDQLALEAELQISSLSRHILHGLAFTVGSALGSDPPTRQECLSAFTTSTTNTGLMAGAKAWSKHAHRSGDAETGGDSVGWWGGQPKGPVASINERALALFNKVMDNATWRNLHWLPHQVLVYEVRVDEGYGMRWSQDRSQLVEEDSAGGSVDTTLRAPWMFRGFVEPMMENGHEVGWRH